MQSASRQRSHNGCVTCKRRRRKCGEERPSCVRCQADGKVCEGYHVVLSWDVGIASRGKFTGAAEPKKELGKREPQGRVRDRKHMARSAALVSDGHEPSMPSMPSTLEVDTGITQHVAEGIDMAVSALMPHSADQGSASGPSYHPHDLTRRLEYQQLFDQFLKDGHHLLYSTETLRSPVRESVSRLAYESEALFLICAAVQAHLSGLREQTILRIYNESLVEFQEELKSHDGQIKEATLMAGALLCTFGILRATPWTMHLEGLSSLLAAQQQQNAATLSRPFTIHITEVLAIMDMPTFCVGRRSPTLHLWRKYRFNRPADEQRIYDDRDIEETSGLPRSLLDMIACIKDPDAEEKLWAWKGHAGEILQVHLWESYRFAAILWARSFNNSEHPRAQVDELQDLIINRLMAALDALYESAPRAEAIGSLTMNAIIYPLFTAGLSVKPSSGLSVKHMLWSSQVDHWLDVLVSKQKQSNAQIVKQLLHDVERRAARGNSLQVDPDLVAYENGQEIALF